MLEETALFLAMPKVLGAIGPTGMKTLVKAGSELWARFGYTTAQEGRSLPQIADVMRVAANEGGFKVDVLTYPDVLVVSGIYKDKRQQGLQEPLSRRRRKTHDRRHTAGVHRVARPALLRSGWQLSSRILGLSCSDQRAGHRCNRLVVRQWRSDHHACQRRRGHGSADRGHGKVSHCPRYDRRPAGRPDPRPVCARGSN